MGCVYLKSFRKLSRVGSWSGDGVCVLEALLQMEQGGYRLVLDNNEV